MSSRASNRCPSRRAWCGTAPRVVGEVRPPQRPLECRRRSFSSIHSNRYQKCAIYQRTPQFFFRLGRKKVRHTKQGSGKPHDACGSWRNKKVFTGKLCASATFRHLIYALMSCWTYSHQCQIADKNPSKRWNGEFWGFRIRIGFVQRDFVFWVFVCSANFSPFPATTPRATTPHRHLTATTPRATMPVQIHSS